MLIRVFSILGIKCKNRKAGNFKAFVLYLMFSVILPEINRVGSTNSNGTGGPLPPLPQRSSNPPPLPNRIGNPSTSSCMSPSSGGIVFFLNKIKILKF